MWSTLLTKVVLPILEWTVPKLFVHLWVEIIALLSMDSGYIFGIISFALVSVFATVNCYISGYVNTSFTKVVLPILEWAVSRLFVHHWVEIIALLSMDSSYIFGLIFFCPLVICMYRSVICLHLYHLWCTRKKKKENFIVLGCHNSQLFELKIILKRLILS